MKRKWTFILGLSVMSLMTGLAHAEYTDEVKSQIQDLQNRYQNKPLDLVYFHDMGIIAKKADSAEINSLTVEIVRTHLLKKMDEFVGEQLKNINLLYHNGNGSEASKLLRGLLEYKNYYQPSEDFLMTGGAKAIRSEHNLFREIAVKSMEEEDSLEAITRGIRAVQQSGLFVTNAGSQFSDMRKLIEKTECSVGWKPTLNYRNEEDFQTDYDAGQVIQEGHLKLQSSGRDLSEAKWVGVWIYHMKGREGALEGTAQATLKFKRGEDMAALNIADSKLNSAGRMNMPMPASSIQKTVEVVSNPISPVAVFDGNIKISLVGCHENKTN